VKRPRQSGDARRGRPRGRPPSEAVDRALERAAVEEFVERGFHAMTMESIAARAGVSKLSLYRRWSSKLVVTEEVFRMLSQTRIPEDQGSLEADLRSLVARATGAGQEALTMAKVLMRTMGEISEHPALLAAYRERLLKPRLEQMRTVLARARQRGELRPDVPVDLASAVVAGPLFLYYLSLLAGGGLQLPTDVAAAFTRVILGGIGATRRARGHP
jgi:AcrR family transcriptional regulator